jgi:ribonuclease HI
VGGSPGRAVYWSVGTDAGVALHDTSTRHHRSDEAELLALLAALRLAAAVADAPLAIVHMDCASLIRLVNRRTAPRCRRLAAPFGDVLACLDELRARGCRVAIRYVPRLEIEGVLGH